MIEIIDRQKKHPVRKTAFKRLLKALIAQHRLDDPDITLVFVGTRAIQTLNRKFMKKDKATDVLSFPIGRKGPDGTLYLGDIAIAVPVAYRQSREKGHSLERELKLLAIHGFLHLAGYDHGSGIEEQELMAHGMYLR